KYPEAIADYTKAIELNPNLATAYYNRGIVLKSLGKTEAAIADFTKAREPIWSKPLPQYIRQK
ncbi:MAG: tetratricopeptide repeat protein, partial [Planctomycetota bacterium]